jgi:hypothetical protein
MQGRRPFVRAINRFGLFVTITVTLAQPVSPQSSLPATRAWGPSTDGLRIAISTIPITPPSTGPEFLISIQNISSRDFVVNLGFMVANGKVMFPEAVRLSLTDPAGTTRDLHFFDRRYPAIVGRVDDFTVALRAGATYEFPVSLDQYVSPLVKLGPDDIASTRGFRGEGRPTSTGTHTRYSVDELLERYCPIEHLGV